MHLFKVWKMLIPLKLRVKESVKPVAQQGGRTPFRLLEKVNKKLDELLELNII